MTQGPHARLAYHGGGWGAGDRALPDEVPVAIVFNGTTQAVMMATPADLTDFARGFALTEGIAAPAEIQSLEILPQPRGIEARVWLTAAAEARLAARRRAMTGPVGCGLCGIDSLEEALRPPQPVVGEPRLTPADVAAAMAGLRAHQALHDATRAVHAAGFYLPGQGVVLGREDVGRHNALDKLAGALVAAGTDAAAGAVVLTSRVSVDMVQKTCAIGAPILIAASAPTALAVAEARTAGLTLIALARGAEFEVFTHPQRLTGAPDV